MGVLRVPGPSVTLLAACRQESPECAHGTGRHPSHGTERPLGVRGPSGDRGPGSPCSGGGKLADSLPGSSDECPPPWLPHSLIAGGVSPPWVGLRAHLYCKGISRSVLDGSSLSDPCHRRPAMRLLNIIPLDSPGVLLVDIDKMQHTSPSALELEAGEPLAPGA